MQVTIDNEQIWYVVVDLFYTKDEWHWVLIRDNFETIEEANEWIVERSFLN